MCAIAGLLTTSPESARSGESVALVKLLCQRQAHRGPDAEGIWSDSEQRAVLGHRRLAVIDLDSRSNQPMKSADGRYVLSFNGEIYNFLSLRNEMEVCGIRFRTASDTEVLIEGYALWGHGLFSRLDGMFALAVFDTQRGELTLARDRLGEKPLFYAHGDGFVVFASEFRPLLGLPGMDYRVSTASLFEYFALRYIPAPYTLFESIHAVQPGVAITITASGAVNERAYFAFDLPFIPPSADTESYIDAVEESLVASIRTRLIADVPLGAFLSSGIDSSLVCALASRRLGKELNCFSAGFAGGDDETDLAERIADRLGLPFVRYRISQDDLLSTISRFGEYLDEPNGDRSCVPTLLLSRLMRRHVTVALSGDGGDELFCGYGRYLGMTNHPSDASDPYTPLTDYLSRLLPVFPLKELEAAFPDQPASFRRRFLSRFTTVMARKELAPHDRLRLIDMHSYLPGAVLPKVDRMGMRHALEIRTPFFSPELLALSRGLPGKLSTSRGSMKLALRGVLARYLPPDLIRQDKRGFGMPAPFMEGNREFFSTLAISADETLCGWSALKDRPGAFSILRGASRSNINSLWAWIALGQWVEMQSSTPFSP